MEDRQHFFEDVCIPRNEFIKEHVHLLKLLQHGNRTQLLAEAKSQEAELKGKTGGSRAATNALREFKALVNNQFITTRTKSLDGMNTHSWGRL